MSLPEESVPTVWTSADETFFLIAHELFAADFLAGAGVLLGSYDSDALPAGKRIQHAGTDAPTAARPARATA